MTPSENVALMKRWYREVWAGRKNETIYELLAADAVVSGHTGAAPIRGPQEFVRFVEQIRKAFPDTEVHVEDAFGVDDKVAVRWTAKGTHSGEGMGEPTGKTIEIAGTTIVHIVDGKIVEGWDNWDKLGMLEQIGAYSAPETVILAKTA